MRQLKWKRWITEQITKKTFIHRLYLKQGMGSPGIGASGDGE